MRLATFAILILVIAPLAPLHAQARADPTPAVEWVRLTLHIDAELVATRRP